jgi:hypothetical protein
MNLRDDYDPAEQLLRRRAALVVLGLFAGGPVAAIPLCWVAAIAARVIG